MIPASGLSAGPDEKRQNGSTRLEEVIRYSEDSVSAADVGPVAASAQQPEGRFAGLVSQVVRPSPAKAAAHDGDEPASADPRTRQPADGASHAETVKRLAQEEFRKFVEQQGRSSSFYDDLPPPSRDS
jgi:hypothetical protein